VTSQLYATEHELTSDKDISSVDFWHRPFAERDDVFRWLRRNAPVSWHLPIEDPSVPPEVHQEAGFWAVVDYENIRFVSQNNEFFSSQLGGVQVRPSHPSLVFPPSFIELDPPAHTQYRQALSAAFTPKAIRKIDDKICARAAEIVDRVVGAGEIDFVKEVSSKLPMLTIADMIGVPDSLSETFAHAGDNFISARDPDVCPAGVSPVDFAIQNNEILTSMGVDLVEHRRKNPTDDIATALAFADIDGRRLSRDEIGAVMLLLSIGGNDTTKQTTTNTLIQLDRNPDQRAWLMEDFEGRINQSIDEFIRHATPVMIFARTATKDLELGGRQIIRGDKVAIFLCSGNRDETMFDDPHRFFLDRPHRPHIGFGGGGIHFCIGSGVAKAQLRALFAEILTKLPRIEVGEPDYLFSEFINGYRRLPVRIGSPQASP
jgi:cytochrome P450